MYILPSTLQPTLLPCGKECDSCSKPSECCEFMMCGDGVCFPSHPKPTEEPTEYPTPLVGYTIHSLFTNHSNFLFLLYLSVPDNTPEFFPDVDLFA